MKTYSGWSGTKDEITFIVESILFDDDNGISQSFPELKARELKSLFCAALASNIVVNEIRDSMIFQFENGEDGSKRRAKLNALRDKHSA